MSAKTAAAARARRTGARSSFLRPSLRQKVASPAAAAAHSEAQSKTGNIVTTTNLEHAHHELGLQHSPVSLVSSTLIGPAPSFLSFTAITCRRLTFCPRKCSLSVAKLGIATQRLAMSLIASRRHMTQSHVTVFVSIAVAFAFASAPSPVPLASLAKCFSWVGLVVHLLLCLVQAKLHLSSLRSVVVSELLSQAPAPLLSLLHDSDCCYEATQPTSWRCSSHRLVQAERFASPTRISFEGGRIWCS